MNTLPTNLIESALALCGKTMRDMYDWGQGELFGDDGDIDLDFAFSYPRFYSFLLSPEFIDIYSQEHTVIIGHFGHAIYYHQSGNHQPLIDLLSKI